MTLTLDGIKAWHANPVMHGLQTTFSPLPDTCAICWLVERLEDSEESRQECELARAVSEAALENLLGLQKEEK